MGSEMCIRDRSGSWPAGLQGTSLGFSSVFPSFFPRHEKHLSPDILKRGVRQQSTVPAFPAAPNSPQMIGPTTRECLPSLGSILQQAGLPARVPSLRSAFPWGPSPQWLMNRRSPIRRRSRAGLSPASLFSRPALSGPRAPSGALSVLLYRIRRPLSMRRQRFCEADRQNRSALLW